MAENDTKFFVRILPREKSKLDSSSVEINEKEVKLVLPEATKQYQKKTFQTDGVFTEHCQNEVYSTVVDERAFEDVTRGTSLIVMAVGEPTSGRTYTMVGIRNTYQFRGIIPRFLKDVFSHVRLSTYKIAVSFIQFLNDKCTDLLSGKVYKAEFYKAIKPTEVTNETEALDFLFTGEKKRSRRRGENCGSAVFSIFIHVPAGVIKRPSISQIHLVDAAGLWNAARIETCIAPLRNLYAWKWPFTMKKAVYDNIDVQDASYKLVPMVGFLRPAISKGIIRIIAHIKDGVQNWRYNAWTLAFCNDLCRKGRPATVNLMDPPYVMRTKDLHNEIQELRDHRDYGQTSDEINFIPYRAEDVLQDYSGVIERFFNNETSENDLMLVAHPTIILRAMRTFYYKIFYDTTKDALTTKSKRSAHSKLQSSERGRSLQRRSLPATDLYGRELERKKREPTNDPQENWKIFWLEFLDRYPEKHRQLSIAIEEIQLARKEKELKHEILKKLKSKAEESEKNAKLTLWKRSLKGGGDVESRPKNRDEQLEEEKETIAWGKRFDDAVWSAQNEFALAHKDYLKKLRVFNDVSSSADMLFMDYVLTTYDCNLALPRVINYEEMVPPSKLESQNYPVKYDLEEHAYNNLKQRNLFKKCYSPPSLTKQVLKYIS